MMHYLEPTFMDSLSSLDYAGAPSRAALISDDVIAVTDGRGEPGYVRGITLRKWKISLGDPKHEGTRCHGGDGSNTR